MSFDLIIFDCDGVLVDSEPIANRVFTRSLNELGLDWSYTEVCDRFIGLSMSRCLELIEQALGHAVPEGFLDELQRRTFEAFHGERLKAVPGVTEAIDALTTPFCVASSGELEKMRATLGMTGLLARFEGRMFSAEQVERGKPAPDLFLFAAASCGAEPDRCAVVEDSVPGVRAAVAARMTVFGYAGRAKREELAAHGASVFDSMAELPDRIRTCPVREGES